MQPLVCCFILSYFYILERMLLYFLSEVYIIFPNVAPTSHFRVLSWLLTECRKYCAGYLRITCNTEGHSLNHCCSGKAIVITYSDCVSVAIVIHHATCVFYCHLWPLQIYHTFPRYLVNATIFGRRLLKTNCVFWFSLQILSETFIILSRIQRDIMINVQRCSSKLPLVCCKILMKLERTRKFAKNPQV